ncbi:MAG: hypothetical protein JW768_14095 [Chitinispirillaceae bacterium]|nr:hypothetical protein [Chitinispirillaceae bacterium]
MQNLETGESLIAHGKSGASWEGFVIEQMAGIFGDRNRYFWATYSGAELDVFTVTSKGWIGFECTLTDAPRTTRSMQTAVSDLGLTHLFVVFPGKISYRLTGSITSLSINDVYTWERFTG